MSTEANIEIDLERITPDRAEDALDAILESEEILTEAFGKPPFQLTLDEIRPHYVNVNNLWDSDSAYIFFIVDKKSRKILGVIGLNRVLRLYQKANLFYWVRTNNQGKGIAFKAAKHIVRFGFNELGLQRIEIAAKTDNYASLRVMEKLGATREGCMRNGMRLNEQISDAYLHSLIPEDTEKWN